MGHVLFRPGRLKLAAVLPITILWFAFAGGAHAAAPSTGTIDQTVNRSTSWQGILYATSNPLLDPNNPGGGPQLCGPTPANDPNCDHFELTTQDTGLVRVVATWPGGTCALLGTCTGPSDNDFDILVCDNSTIDQGELDPLNLLGNSPPPDNCTGGTEIAYFPGNLPGFEGGVFPAIGGKTYEIRVLPLSILFPGSDYNGCAEYTDVGGTATNCAPTPVFTPPPVAASEFLAGCPPEVNGPLQRQVDGGGNLPAISSPNQKATFSINVRRHKDSNGKTHFRGKVNYKEDHAVRFRSENATCATFTDGTNTKDDNHDTVFRGRGEVRGLGQVRQDDQQQEQRVCYRAVGEDNGQPGGGRDRFEIELFSFDPTLQTCSALPINANNNIISQGNIKYKFRVEGTDDP